MADYNADSVSKQWTIEYDGGVLTNTDIRAEGIRFKSSLCSDSTLKFGGCEASEFSVTFTNTGESFLGKRLLVSVTTDGETTHFPPFIVTSDKVNADRTSRSIVAYDDLYRVLNEDMTEWYKGLPGTITIKRLRDMFFEHFEIEQDNINLPNDMYEVRITDTQKAITGKDIITAICEINGCFGQIMNDWLFHYIFLENLSKPSDTLYPSNTLYPGSRKSDSAYGKTYKTMSYEDYYVQRITGLTIVGADSVYDFGTDDNRYVMDNIITMGSDGSQLNNVSDFFFGAVKDAVFVPATIEARGNPNLQVGDKVEAIHRNGTVVSTFVLSKTLSGAQALNDSISSSVAEKQQSNNNSISSRVSALSKQYDWTKNMIDENTVRVNGLLADHVSVGQLNAVSARVGSLEADHVTVGQLDATNANIERLFADSATVGQLNAVNARVNGKLDTNQLSAQISALSGVSAKSISCDNYLANYGGKGWLLVPMQVSINGTMYVILGARYTG